MINERTENQRMILSALYEEYRGLDEYRCESAQREDISFIKKMLSHYQGDCWIWYREDRFRSEIKNFLSILPYSDNIIYTYQKDYNIENLYELLEGICKMMLYHEPTMELVRVSVVKDEIRLFRLHPSLDYGPEVGNIKYREVIAELVSGEVYKKPPYRGKNGVYYKLYQAIK